MPAFITTVLQSIFVGITDFFAHYLSRKAAKVVAGVGVMVTLTATFIGALVAALSGIQAVAPSWLVLAWGWFMPSNAVGCLSAYAAIYVARWVYDQNLNYQTSLFR